MSILYHVDGYKTLYKYVRDHTEDISQDANLNIDIDQSILHEVLALAKRSADRHFQGKVDKDGRPARVSNYKEAAHLCFWIAKLKPIKVLKANHIIDALDELLHRLFTEPEIAEAKASLAENSDAGAYPINEQVGLYVSC